MPQPNEHKAFFRGKVIGTALVSAIGLLCVVFFPIADSLARWSYDLAFLPRLFRPSISEGIVLVNLDQPVQVDMGVPTDQLLDRRLHAKLVRKLKEDGARLILFDFVFGNPSADPTADQEFAESIRQHGMVVLAAGYEKGTQAGLYGDSISPPMDSLRAAAAAWGLARLTGDPDEIIRKLDSGAENWPSVSWQAAKLAHARITDNPHTELLDAWLNYYGPLTSFISVNMDRVLAENGLRAGFFSNSIVVVGARPLVNRAGGDPPENFSTPFSHFGRPPASGAQIHALSLLNLLRGDWIVRVSRGSEIAVALLCGIILGGGLGLLRPWPATALTLALLPLLGLIGVYLQLYDHLWWSWLVPAVQAPIALVWSVGYQYAVELRRRNRYRHAFAGYLSPHIADQIAEGDFDLSLGGKVVEATVMFSDLAGFTAMSESLKPQEVSAILIAYFNQTTRGIRDHDGTLIRYMGDAVMAVWGAPVPNERHAEHAVRAAWAMVQAGKPEIAGHKLRTRIGINTGQVLAGNLGSVFRFDYTAIGDTTNLASRLETLNKQLGTDLLISAATRQQLSDGVRSRALGRFVVAGKSQAITIHEVIGVDEAGAAPEWLAAFDDALRQFQARNLNKAKELFSQVVKLRAGHDGPSEFYLQQIAAASPKSVEPWDGTVILESK